MKTKAKAKSKSKIKTFTNKPISNKHKNKKLNVKSVRDNYNNLLLEIENYSKPIKSFNKISFGSILILLILILFISVIGDIAKIGMVNFTKINPFNIVEIIFYILGIVSLINIIIFSNINKIEGDLNINIININNAFSLLEENKNSPYEIRKQIMDSIKLEISNLKQTYEKFKFSVERNFLFSKYRDYFYPKVRVETDKVRVKSEEAKLLSIEEELKDFDQRLKEVYEKNNC